MNFNPLSLLSDLKTLPFMLRAIIKGQYKMPWGTLVWVLVCAVYFLSPIDALPDIIPLLGFADDGAFLIFVLLLVHADLSTFRLQQKKESTILEAEVVNEEKHD